MSKRKGVDRDRRAFLGSAAGVAVPAGMVMLLSTSLTSPAIASSAGVVSRGGGDDDSDLPLLAFLGLVPVAAATRGAPAAAQAAPVAVAPAAPQEAAPIWSGGSGGSAPPPGRFAAAPVGRPRAAPAAKPQAAPGGPVRIFGGPRVNEVTRAGDRG